MSAMGRCFQILCIFVTLLSSCQAVTGAEIKDLKTKLKDGILSENRRNVALCVRNAFHDCVGEAGCDGCIDLAIKDNKGLEKIVPLLDTFHQSQTTTTGLSKADIYALCGIAATEVGFANNGVNKELTFKVGRKDTVDCTGSNKDEFPNPHHSFDDTMEFFNEQFGMDQREAVIILGAHSLGRCHPKDSGFKGPRTRNSSNLSKDYYAVLLHSLTDKWEQKNVGNTRIGIRFEWQKPRAGGQGTNPNRGGRGRQTGHGGRQPGRPRGRWGSRTGGGQTSGRPAGGRWRGIPTGGRGRWGGRPTSSRWGGRRMGGRGNGRPTSGRWGGRPTSGRWGGRPTSSRWGGRRMGGRGNGRPTSGRWGGRPMKRRWGSKKRSPMFDETVDELRALGKRQALRPRCPQGGLMMLNCDMCLVKDIEVADNGKATCAADISTCPEDSPTLETVKELASPNSNAFNEKFPIVFTKMIEKVAAGVTLQEATTTVTGVGTRMPGTGVVTTLPGTTVNTTTLATTVNTTTPGTTVNTTTLGTTVNTTTLGTTVKMTTLGTTVKTTTPGTTVKTTTPGTTLTTTTPETTVKTTPATTVKTTTPIKATTPKVGDEEALIEDIESLMEDILEQ